MDRRIKHLAALVAAFFCLPVLAGYAEAVPPPGWSNPEAGADYGTFRRGASAANSPWVNGSARGNVTTNVGGRPVSIPAKMRMAANGGRFVGRFMFGNPWVLLAGAGLPLLLDWLNDGGYELIDGVWHKRTQGSTEGLCTTGPCYSYYLGSMSGEPATTGTTPEAACSAKPGVYVNSSVYMSSATVVDYGTVQAVQPSVWVSSGKGCRIEYRMKSNNSLVDTKIGQIMWQGRNPDPAPAPTYSPAAPQEMEDSLSDKPVPDDVANEFPGPLPIEQPVINPGPLPEELPSVWREPVGLPQPVPDTNPQKYKQPVVDVVPAPTTKQPWRIDLQPKDVVSEDPAGQTEGQPVSEAPQGTVSPKEQQDFCSANPGALACQELDEPEDVDLEQREPDLTITPDSGWGSDNASCPAPRSVDVLGQAIPIEYTLFCDFFAGMRPVVIAVAWLIAAGLILGAVRRG